VTAPNAGESPEFIASDVEEPSDLRTDVPTAARMYDYDLGGKDSFAVDRAAVQAGLAHFPGILDAARNNRLFLYRAVRFLARDAGIRQYLDMGSGLPTQNNVHQVAQQFQPDARVVYVDNDPIVLAHGRALLATDQSTTVITADMTNPEEILAHPDTRRLLDFSEPVAVLFLSVGHSIVDDATVHSMLAAVKGAIVPGSYIAFTQMVGVDQQVASESTKVALDLGLVWKTRTPDDVIEFLRGLEPVEPGLVDITDWRPDPSQPALAPVDEPLRQYIGASANDQRHLEFGGIARRN
jgi:S-adenosyl methyltransferase